MRWSEEKNGGTSLNPQNKSERSGSCWPFIFLVAPFQHPKAVHPALHTPLISVNYPQPKPLNPSSFPNPPKDTPKSPSA
ncbi:hypothetical protein F7725_005596 [Dissostichus mawsoni]|uniref:Uncharacterized protein n=1 Tax=Dissostichus mawsoni TaxID=36200 RepID=A0A7J5YTQ2_DISMA|nr:hypothetical protein F7725_005596 [Dissostichus mawsoni]